VLLAAFGAMPVWGALIKQLVKASANGQKRQFGAERYQQDFAPVGAMASGRAGKR